jgi:cbb3-type cytochrome oxidase subunit 3
MTTLLEHYPWLKSLWTVWFFVVFVGLIIWTMWPSRRDTWTARGEIPLRDAQHLAKDQ